MAHAGGESHAHGRASVKEAMRILHDLEAGLLERDGAGRDLNFENPTWWGVRRLSEALRVQFESTTVGSTTADTELLQVTDPTEALERVYRDGGYAQILFAHGRVFVSDLQPFVASDANSPPFVELTFFPEDVIPDVALAATFVDWLASLQQALHADRAFARYESVSWEFGNTAFGSGVFLVLG
jgi:hypothetical protein